MKTANDNATERVGPATESASAAAPNPVDPNFATPEAAFEPGGPPESSEAYRRLLAEKQELHDQLLRKQAELQNVRKRAERENEEFRKHATAELIRALLPALDSFERALKHRDPRVPPEFYKGVELIHQELTEVLKRAGLDPVETLGKTFDPNLHQAVETVESGQHRDQEIVEELQRGYQLRQRLLRPAVVKVAVPPKTGKAEASASAKETVKGSE